MSVPEYGTEPGADSKTPFDPFAFAIKHKPILGAVAVMLIGFVAVIGYLSWKNNINNEAFGRQRDVVTQYQSVQTELSTCLDNSLISSQVAQTERASLKDILIGTASARYVDASGKPVDTGQAMTAGVVINNKSIVENYPDVNNALFKQLMTTAVGCRNQVAGAMENLQALAGRFDTWTHQGSIFAKPIRSNYPNDELVVTGLGGQKLTGKAALTFLATPILTGDAARAVQSHTMSNQQLFPTPAP